MNPPTKPQQKQTTTIKSNSGIVRQKLNAAKSTLGLRNLNIASAVSGHEKVNKLVAQNPKQQFNQILNRLSQAERNNYVAATSHVSSDSLDDRVSMSAFRRQLQAIKSSKPLMNSVEPFSNQDQIVEAIAGFKDEQNPPVMIVLQRKGIRIFPDGKKVAMYHNKQLGLVITIPYAGTGNSPGEIIPGANMQMEEVEQINEIGNTEKGVDRLKKYVASDRSKVKIKDVLDAKRSADPEKAIENLAKRQGYKAKALKKIRAFDAAKNPKPKSTYDGEDRGYGQGRYMGDSVETTGDLLENLDQVAAYAQQDNVTSHAKHFKFADGSKLKVSHGAAKAIHMVHGALNDENKKKFADMLTTPKGFEKAAHFALSKVQFTIGGK